VRMEVDSSNIHKYWFKSNVNEIIIVTSKESKPPRDAYTFSKNYAYLDQVGDKDLVFYTAQLLARHYPAANIEIYFSGDLTKGHRQKNLVVLGGPSGRNQVCQYFMEQEEIAMVFKYPPKPALKTVKCKKCSNIANDCPRESICVYGNILGYEADIVEAEMNDAVEASVDNSRIVDIGGGRVLIHDCIKRDYGFFAAFDNPYNLDSRVVMISGIHTYGGCGSFLAFEDRCNRSNENYKKVSLKLGNKNNFFSYFSVDVCRDQGSPVSCPEVEDGRIFNFEKRETEKSFVPSQSIPQIITDCNVPLLQKEIADDKAKMDIIARSVMYEQHNQRAMSFSKVLADWHTKLFSANPSECKVIQGEYDELIKNADYLKIISLQGGAR